MEFNFENFSLILKIKFRISMTLNYGTSELTLNLTNKQLES